MVAIVFLVVYLFAQDSKKETTREKYGEAIGQVAHSAASTIAGIALTKEEWKWSQYQDILAIIFYGQEIKIAIAFLQQVFFI